MDKAARDAVDQRREARPKNTKKGYKKGLACWAAFCTRRQFTDKDTVQVTDANHFFFLTGCQWIQIKYIRSVTNVSAIHGLKTTNDGWREIFG